MALGCRADNLAKITDSLQFRSPDQPSAVSQKDSSDVEIDFGEVGVGAVKTLTLQYVSNGASIALGSLTVAQADDEFALPLTPGTMVGSQPAQCQVTFAPTSLGVKTAIYKLATDATGASLVTLTLTGQGVPEALSVTPDPIDFGNVELNKVGMVSVTIANGGSAPAVLSLSALGGANSSAFTLDPPSTDSLAVGEAVTLETRFAPQQSGAASTFFTLSGCATCGRLTVPLVGTGVTSVLQVTPDPMQFGSVSIASNVDKSLVISNLGNQVVQLLAPGPILATTAAMAGFSFGPPVAATPSAYPFALAAGQSAVLPISFVPPRPGFFSSGLSFGSDDPAALAVVVPLSGYGGGARIACLPSALAFGAVAVGQSAHQTIICTNVGSDVPGHPEAALQIGGLVNDNPLFAGAFATGSGGLGQDGGISLIAGASVAITVSYGPSVAESDTGTLTVASNDTQTPALVVGLAGQGVVPGMCSVTTSPNELSFGEVPAGESGQQLFEISNGGQSYCLISDIGLDPASDPAFSVPGGPPPPFLLGFAGNAGGAPVALRVPVRFAPRTSEQQAGGKVTFAASGATGGTVALTGSSASACLVVTPPSFDFGEVGFNPASNHSCVDETASFIAQNACPQSVTLDAIGINSGLDATPQFGLLQAPTPPVTVAPGEQVSFGASFAPTSVGLKAGGITLTSSEFPATPYRISLLGNSAIIGQRTDTFAAQQNKIDLVFVLDDDDDSVEIQAVAGELPGFIHAADAAQLDYRIALTSTDTCSAIPSDQGFFEPCDHCTSSVSTSPTYFTSQTQNAAQILADLFNLHQGTACAPSMVGDEHFFQALEETFQPTLLAGHNAGFLRDDAYLAIVVINGDGEDDRSNITTQAAIDMVRALKPDPRMVSVSYIDDGLSAINMAYQMTALVSATGGAILDTTTGWVPGLFDLLWADERLGGFALSTSPDPFTLVVEENGVPFARQSNGETIWAYDSVTNSVVFTPANLPVPGTVITISYSLSCP